jgi:hypothetical protein
VKYCEKFGKNMKNRALFAKNSVVLVSFVAFWGHFIEMRKVRKKSPILAGAGMRFAYER